MSLFFSCRSVCLNFLHYWFKTSSDKLYYRIGWTVTFSAFPFTTPSFYIQCAFIFQTLSLPLVLSLRSLLSSFSSSSYSHFSSTLPSFPLTSRLHPSLSPSGDPLQFPGDPGGAGEADVQRSGRRRCGLVWFPSCLPLLPHPLRRDGPARVDGYLHWCSQGTPAQRTAQVRSGSGWKVLMWGVCKVLKMCWNNMTTSIETPQKSLNPLKYNSHDFSKSFQYRRPWISWLSCSAIS